MKLEIRHVTKRYRDKMAAADVSLTLTPGVWRIVAAAWRDNREYGYIAVQVGGTEHGGIEPTYGHGRVLDVTLTLTENTSCRVLTRSDYVVGGCWAIVRQP